MNIRLETFAILRELLEQEFLDYDVPIDSTADQLINQLVKSFPSAEPILNVTRIAHRDEYLMKDEILLPGETYALIPPVSGG